MTKDTQRHGEVAACHALIAHGRLGRTEMESRQENQGEFQEETEKLCSLPLQMQISVLLCTPCPGQWQLTAQEAQTHSQVENAAQPFPDWCLGVGIMDPVLLCRKFQRQLFTIYRLFQPQHFTKLQSFVLSRASSFSLIPASPFPCDSWRSHQLLGKDSLCDCCLLHCCLTASSLLDSTAGCLG